MTSNVAHLFQMTDDWQIASLSQTIEEEEDDDALVPPTPGQEDVDMATPSQDSASLLSAMTESQGIGIIQMKSTVTF